MSIIFIIKIYQKKLSQIGFRRKLRAVKNIEELTFDIIMHKKSVTAAIVPY